AQCREQNCVVYVGQIRLQITGVSGSDFAANQHIFHYFRLYLLFFDSICTDYQALAENPDARNFN
ncbi:hypothetical protein, partial [Duganella fentianensis]|uniref:hypothetical protein n=1 Tax=Duganella fentianensis TaxID=2692177 RepID=UPI0032B1A41F